MDEQVYIARLQRAALELKDTLLDIYYTEDHLSDEGFKKIERAYKHAKILLKIK